MAKKRKAQGKKRGKKQGGKGKVTDAAKKLAKLAKDKKVLSKALGVGAVLTKNPALAKASAVASQLGLGQTGGNIFGDILGTVTGGIGTGINRGFRGLLGGARSKQSVINV